MEVKVLVILISKANRVFIGKSPHVMENVNLYNKIYMETAVLFPNVHLVTPFDDSVDINSITVDETHVNAEGHRIILEKIMPYLREK